jgi:hypothetical protein
MARRRSRKELDYLSYQHTPDRQLEHPSGWCMTDYHEGCKHQFNHGKCGCKCHTVKENIIKKSTPLVDSNDPRPWRKQ